MIDKIVKSIVEDQLFVTVICSPRKLAKDEIKELTTHRILGILEKEGEFEVIKTLAEPCYPVGNSLRRDMKTSGQWVFQVRLEKKQEASKKQTRRSKPQHPPTKKTTKTKPASIRERMAKLTEKNNGTDKRTQN